MKIWVAATICLFCGFFWCKLCFGENRVDLDLIEKHIRFSDFYLGDKSIDSDIYFRFKNDGAFGIELKGRNTRFNNQYIGSFEARLTKKGAFLFIEKLNFLQYRAKGTLNLKTYELNLNIEGRWHENSKFLKGQISVYAKAWGKLSNIVISGYLTVDNGVYEGQEFSKLRLDFLGKPPLLNITDSQIILYDGSTFAYVDAVLDLRNFSSPIIPNPEFVSHKVYFGDWQVFGEDQTRAGLKKKLDKKIDVFIDANDVLEDGKDTLEGGTELRYNWKGSDFLKLRMEENRTILGFERRTEF